MSNPQTHHFQLNSTINSIVGNNPFEGQDLELFLKIADKQIDLIRDEFDELLTGFATKNFKEIRDGIGDVIVTVDGLFYRLNLEYPNTQSWPDLPGEIPKALFEAAEALAMMKDVASGLDENNLSSVQLMLRTMATGVLLSMYQISASLGIDLAADQKAIFDSNISKFDKDITTAERGVAKYGQIGVSATICTNTSTCGIYHVLKSSWNQIGADGKKYAEGKFLKSVNFQEPNLNAPLLEGEHMTLDMPFMADVDFLIHELRGPIDDSPVD
jgi:hypothetical protein